jgi:hypothetical protein
LANEWCQLSVFRKTVLQLFLQSLKHPFVITQRLLFHGNYRGDRLFLVTHDVNKFLLDHLILVIENPPHVRVSLTVLLRLVSIEMATRFDFLDM